jgi:hypothetical protein
LTQTFFCTCFFCCCWIRDPILEKVRICNKHSGSATLVVNIFRRKCFSKFRKLNFFCGFSAKEDVSKNPGKTMDGPSLSPGMLSVGLTVYIMRTQDPKFRALCVYNWLTNLTYRCVPYAITMLYWVRCASWDFLKGLCHTMNIF